VSEEKDDNNQSNEETKAEKKKKHKVPLVPEVLHKSELTHQRLTTKEVRFCEEYVMSGDAMAAFYRAFGMFYTSGDGMRRRRTALSVKRKCDKLLGDPRIVAEIQVNRKMVARATHITSTKWLRELSIIAFGDTTDLYENDPDTGFTKNKPLDELTPAQRKMVRAVKVRKRRLKKDGEVIEEVENSEFVPHDKLEAMKMIGKHLGYMNDLPDLDIIINQLPANVQKSLRDQIANNEHMLPEARKDEPLVIEARPLEEATKEELD